MELLTKELKKQLPPIYSTEDIDYKDKVAVCKFFLTGTALTWYAVEFDPATEEFFGLIDGYDKELGYFTMQELKSIRGQFNMPVERDLSFEPTKLKEL